MHDVLRYNIGLELIGADKYEKGELSRQGKDLCVEFPAVAVGTWRV